MSRNSQKGQDMSYKIKAFAILGIGVLIIGTQSLFSVQETEQALIERFGQLRKALPEAGLYLKTPFVDNVIYIEKRVLNLESEEIQAILEDKKQLVVDAFARYKIIDSIKFYQAAGTLVTAQDKISTILDSATRSVLGKQTLNDILSGERVELMNKIRVLVDKQTRDFGIEVIDVRIRRADLPPENSISVFNRMKAERQQQAAQFRAEGRQKAVEITSNADRMSEIILAEAKRDAEILRGEGDGERNRIYAESYSQDSEFFEFYRTMISYERSLGNKKGETSVILSTDTDFLKYLKKGAD